MIDEESAGELDQGQVVLGFLLVADAEFAEAVMPAIGALDAPAPRGVTRCPRRGGSGRRRGAPLARRMQLVAARLGRLVGSGVVEALIPAQVLGMPGGRGGARDHDAVQRSRRHL